MIVPAHELWTGDMVVLHEKLVTKFQHEGDIIHVTLADVVPSHGQPPIEVKNEEVVDYHRAELVTVMRDQPLFNGMHMTQIDTRGMLRGRAHPALEKQYREAGKLHPEYERGAT